MTELTFAEWKEQYVVVTDSGKKWEITGKPKLPANLQSKNGALAMPTDWEVTTWWAITTPVTMSGIVVVGADFGGVYAWASGGVV